MFSRDDDETEDPRRYRRSLESLNIEDAEKPLSFFHRIIRLFRRKRPSEAGGMEFGPSAPGHGKIPEGTKAPEASLPENADDIS